MTTPALGLPPRACGCPGAGVVPPDREDDHRRYHDLVEQQTGIRYGEPLNLSTIQAARGLAGSVSSAPLAARNEALGKSSPGWRRQAHHGTAPAPLPTPAEGRAAAIAGADLALASAGALWEAEAKRVILDLAADAYADGRTFTSNDAWERGLPDPPSGNRRALGGIITRAARAGLIVKAGTGALSLHGHGASNLAVWAGTAKAATLRGPRG